MDLLWLQINEEIEVKIDSEAVIIRDKENIDFQTEVMPCREANKANWSHYSLPKDAAIQSRYSTNF